MQSTQAANVMAAETRGYQNVTSKATKKKILPVSAAVNTGPVIRPPRNSEPSTVPRLSQAAVKDAQQVPASNNFCFRILVTTFSAANSDILLPNGSSQV